MDCRDAATDVGLAQPIRHAFARDPAGFVWFLGCGYGIALKGFRASLMTARPFTSENSPVDYALGGFASVGWDIDLWVERSASNAAR